MHSPQIFEAPYPQMRKDWRSGQHQWREITPMTYQALKAAVLRHNHEPDAFMQAEPVDILPHGDGLYICGKRENGYCFARLLPGEDWWKRDYLPTPEVQTLF